MKIVRSSLASKGFSVSVVDLLLAGVRGTTYSAYQLAWNCWINWCIRFGADPLFPPLNLILEFLSDCHKDGKAYRTINVFRSMFSSTIDPIDGHPVGQHPIVIRLMKGMYLTNPPKAKYSSMWNVDSVLAYISSLCPNSDLNMSLLSKKLVLLLALTTLLRVSELASISKSSLILSEDRAYFSLSKVRKAQSDGSLHRLSLMAFRNDPLLCPVRCLEAYTYLTDVLRDSTNADSLFIALKRPHMKVGGSTLGRWIKDILFAAGVDTSSFSAHSTRGASASKAVSCGVPIADILETAHWSRESTFARFYHRGTGSHFQESVLSSVDLINCPSMFC